MSKPWPHFEYHEEPLSMIVYHADPADAAMHAPQVERLGLEAWRETFGSDSSRILSDIAIRAKYNPDDIYSVSMRRNVLANPNMAHWMARKLSDENGIGELLGFARVEQTVARPETFGRRLQLTPNLMKVSVMEVKPKTVKPPTSFTRAALLFAALSDNVGIDRVRTGVSHLDVGTYEWYLSNGFKNTHDVKSEELTELESIHFIQLSAHVRAVRAALKEQYPILKSSS